MSDFPQPTEPLGAPAVSGPAEPVRAPERIEALDVLRGFAIFGILLVNVPFFFSPIYAELAGVEWWPRMHDRLADAAITFAAQGKFYALFSVLFGVGLAMQAERAQARGAGAAAFLARRMSGLLVLGLAHALLLWYGDILAVYALLGFVAIVFVRRRSSTLLVWILLLLAVPLLLITVALAAGAGGDANGDGRGEALARLAEARFVYAEGSLAQIFRVRAREWAVTAGWGLLGVGPQILALFLVGLSLGRHRVFRQPDRHLPWIRASWPPLLLGGMAGGILLVLGQRFGQTGLPGPWTLAQVVGQILGAPVLAAFYACAVVLLLRHERWHRCLAPLGYVGRMALTNYILQSVIFTTLSYSYGLGLYGRVSPAMAPPLAAAVFLLQVPLSRWWLSRFRFGPLEWLWRSWTYGKVQPMRVAGA